MMQSTTEYSKLDITNSFIFAKVMTDSGLCKELLEIILQIKIKKIEYIESEKTFDYSPDSHGIRLDVYVNDEIGTIYDIEMQVSNTKELPKRSRYYQSMIDMSILEKNVTYKELKRSYIIFICMQDIFERGLYVYTFNNICREDNSIELNDETTKIFLNPYGKGQISKELDEFFSYLREHKPSGQFTQALDDSVISARQNALWRKEYMTVQQEIKLAYKDGLAAGLEALVESLSTITGSFDELYEIVHKNDHYADISKSQIREIYDKLN